MASASVKLIIGASFSGRGPKFKKNETKIITKDSDIAYYKGNSRFRVKMMKEAPAPVAPPRAAPKPQEAEKTGNEDGEDGDGDGDSDDGPLPWTKNMKKADLIVAAESRDIAVTSDDKVAEIVQLLTEHDEDEDGD